MADSTYRSGEHLIQTAQTQCDCANTMRWGLFFWGIAKKAVNVYKKNQTLKIR